MKMWMQRIEKIEKIGKDNLHSKDLLSKLTLTMLSNQTLVRELVYLSKHGGLDTIQGMNRKEKKFTKNDVQYMTNDRLMLSFL